MSSTRPGVRHPSRDLRGHALSGILILGWLAGSRLLPAQDFQPAERVGTITDSRIIELSGMVPVSGEPGVFWIHNDSDDIARIFAIRESGAVIAEVRLAGAGASDYEDIAQGPGPDPARSYLYVADTGNNALDRTTVFIYRIEEPRLPHLRTGQLITSSPAHAIPFRYPDGPLNCETLVVDPSSGELYVVSKQSGVAGVYRFPDRLGAGGTQTLLRLGSLSAGDLVTAGDVSRDGRRLLLRTYSRVLESSIAGGVAFDRLFFSPRRVLPSSLAEPKSESICFDHDDRDYLTSNEGNPAPVHRFRRREPQPRCPPPVNAGEPFEFRRGDLVDSGPLAPGPLNVADVAAIVEGLSGGRDLDCEGAADVDDDGRLTIDDARLLGDRLVAGRSLARPYPSPGPDPSPDDLPCREELPAVYVPHGATWSVWSEATPPPLEWNAPDFDAAAWPLAPGGIGFGRSDLGTTLTGVRNSHPTIYARHVFEGEGLQAGDSLALRIDFNDGFVAYLNGIEVARKGVGLAGYRTAFGQLASFHRGGQLEEFFICPDELLAGRNVLAIEVHNRSVTDSTLHFRAELRRRTPRPATPDPTSPANASRARLRFAPGGPLNVGDPAVIPLLYTSDTPLRAVSAVWEYDPTVIRSVSVLPGDETALASVLSFSASPSRRTVSVVVAASDHDPRAAFPGADGGELLRWVVEPLSEGTGETFLEFVLRPGSVPLDTLLVTEDGERIVPEMPIADIDLTRDGGPDVRDVIETSARPGDPVLLIGTRLEEPGLSVEICGREADFTVLQAGTLLRIIIPECELTGHLPVRVCNDLGCDDLEEAVFIEGDGLRFVRGDANGDGRADLTDAIAMLEELFQGKERRAACAEAVDANGDAVYDLTDAIHLLAFLFQGVVAMPPPHPDPGPCP